MSDSREDQRQLKDEANKYAHTPLYFVLQPDYRKLNKAQKSFYALAELAYEVKRIQENPKNVHDTAVDDAFKKQKIVLEDLRKDYPQEDNINAFKEAEEHLVNAYHILKKLRGEVPRETATAAAPSKAKSKT